MIVAIKDSDGEITVGHVLTATIGETVKVQLYDENSDLISATGVVVEIVEE